MTAYLLGMAEQERMKVLTDAQWDQLAPLIEACRPHGKTKPQDLRRTIEAIIWRHDNGAKWRSIPTGLGPWWIAAPMFNRWGHRGVLGASSGTGATAWRPQNGDDFPRRHP
jgi:transposase